MQSGIAELDGLENSSKAVRALVEPPRIEKLGGFDRERLSATTKQLLSVLAAGDYGRPLPRVEADWEEVFQAVCRNGLVGLTYTYLKENTDGHHPPAEFRRRIAAAHLHARARMVQTHRSTKRALSVLSEAGIDCLVLKGPAIAAMIYPDPSLRWYGDLDLHVRERDVPTVHKLFRGAGFLPIEADHDHAPPKLVPQEPGAEWNYVAPDYSFLIELHGDDLLHAGLVPRDYEGLWARAVTVDVHGVPAKGLCLEDQLVALSAHVHYHGYTRLNWLSDMAFLVRDHAKEINWERLIQTVREEEVQVPVYYTIFFVERILGVAAPEAVLRRIKPNWFRRQVHEYFLPTSKVVSLDPMPRPDFSFYFLPLFQRLIPDILVMGRRWDKLKYLARLLAPSPAWLRHYYNIAETESLTVHYALHPLKLVWHYIVSIALAAAWLLRKNREQDAAALRWWSAGAGTPGWGLPIHC